MADNGTTASPPATPAGWYPDGMTTNLVRYWDGFAWTDHTQPVAQATAPPLPKKTMSLALVALLVGIGAFLFGLVPVFGALVGIAAIVLGVLALRKQQSKGMAITGIVLGSLAVFLGIGVAAGLNNVSADGPAGVIAESASPKTEEAVDVVVPDVVGKTGDVAKEELKDAGFQVEWSETVLSPKNWDVEAQDPVGSTSAESGSTVTLIVSKTESVEAVPDVVGKTGDVAKEALKDAGFQVEWSENVFSPKNWTVDAQDPAGTTSVKPGSTVTLSVSKSKAPEKKPEAPKKKEIEVTDMSGDGTLFVSASYPVSDTWTSKGILRNLKEGCVDAIQAAKDETDNWWDYDIIQCAGMADWTDAIVAVGSANFSGAQLAEISDAEMIANPEAFWDLADSSNVMPDLR